MLLLEVKILFFGVSRDNRTGTSRRRQNNESDYKTKKTSLRNNLVSGLRSLLDSFNLDVVRCLSPNHFSCCTNVAALFSFFDFSRNLLTTVFGSEILRQRRECCLLAFPSSKEFTHYIKFVVCVCLVGQTLMLCVRLLVVVDHFVRFYDSCWLLDYTIHHFARREAHTSESRIYGFRNNEHAESRTTKLRHHRTRIEQENCFVKPNRMRKKMVSRHSTSLDPHDNRFQEDILIEHDIRLESTPIVPDKSYSQIAAAIVGWSNCRTLTSWIL